jgi:hypothetical protein
MEGTMSAPPPQESPQPEDQERRSVLADLPHTRPQRASARRERARARAGSGRPATNQKTSKQAKPAAAREKAKPAPARGKAKPPTRKHAASPRPSAPRQGYECDQELAGSPVAPPSGTEVIGALAELAGELAQTGVSAGGRLLKSALSRLSGS